MSKKRNGKCDSEINDVLVIGRARFAAINVALFVGVCKNTDEEFGEMGRGKKKKPRKSRKEFRSPLFLSFPPPLCSSSVLIVVV